MNKKAIPKSFNYKIGTEFPSKNVFKIRLAAASKNFSCPNLAKFSNVRKNGPMTGRKVESGKFGIRVHSAAAVNDDEMSNVECQM